MYLFGTHVTKLQKHDIVRLAENKIREDSTLEYKRELHTDEGRDKGRQELLCDITAMYNADGGCIIYGIQEAKDSRGKNTGYPEKIVGTNVDNHDALILRLRDIIRSGTQPSISNIEILPLEIENVTVLVLGVPKGFGLPAMVTYNDMNKFYRRNNSGKYAVDVFELNQLFMQNQDTLDTAEQFKSRRINDVMTGSVYPNLEKTSALFVSVLPAGYRQNALVSLNLLKQEEMKDAVAPLKIHFSYNKIVKSTESTFNYDGFMYYRTSGSEDQIFAYNQFFRNGAIEFFTNEYYVDRESNNINENYFFGAQMVKAVFQAVHKAREVWSCLELSPPFFLFVSLRVPPSSFAGALNHYQGKLTRSIFDLPYAYFDNFPTTNVEIYAHLKKHFDIIWQTVGKNAAPEWEDLNTEQR